jgi:hypothetical protein
VLPWPLSVPRAAIRVHQQPGRRSSVVAPHQTLRRTLSRLSVRSATEALLCMLCASPCPAARLLNSSCTYRNGPPRLSGTACLTTLPPPSFSHMIDVVDFSPRPPSLLHLQTCHLGSTAAVGPVEIPSFFLTSCRVFDCVAASLHLSLSLD